LKWEDPADVDLYAIQVRCIELLEDGGESEIDEVMIEKGIQEYEYKNLKPETKYVFRLCSINNLLNKSETVSSDEIIIKKIVEKTIKIFAHRGVATLAPDCSKPAWELAKSLGYYGLEVDIQSTKDGVMVVYHDDELNELTNGSGKINDYTWNELSNVIYTKGANIENYPEFQIFPIQVLQY